jgi:hypothetical protein
MGYNKASLELMGREDDRDDEFDMIELSNGKLLVLWHSELEEC